MEEDQGLAREGGLNVTEPRLRNSHLLEGEKDWCSSPVLKTLLRLLVEGDRFVGFSPYCVED